jgi:hypothetical protein
MLYWWFRRDTSRSGARWIDGNMIEMAVVRELRTATAFQEGVFTHRLDQRTNRGSMRGWSGSGPLGRTGRQRVCHLVGRRAPRPAVRLHRNFHVVRWFGRRVAVPMAPEAGATSADGILPDFGSIVAADWPPFLLHSSFACNTLPDRGDRDGPGAARFGHRVDSGYRPAGT